MAVNVTIPAYNEQEGLVRALGVLISGPARGLTTIIVNNGSTDRTLEIAQQFARQHDNIRVLHLDQKGRGRALKHAWLNTEADILSYMDVDLSSDLASFPALIAPLLSGEYDLAIGSRLLKPELTKRCLKREVISRVYNLMVKAVFRTRFSDAQCGFKAITQKAAHELLPLVEDNEWFFDTELLVLAEKLGYRIFDLPVPWIEDPDSRVKIVRTAIQDIRGMIRLWHKLRRGGLAPAPSGCRHSLLRTPNGEMIHQLDSLRGGSTLKKTLTITKKDFVDFQRLTQVAKNNLPPFSFNFLSALTLKIFATHCQ